MPLFTVVVPTFNRADLIAATLESIAAQTFRDFETIVVDDGSSDRTCDIVESFPFVRLIRQQNSGPGVARNHAIEFATGTYIAFLDSDDVWFPWTLATYAETIDRSGSPAFIAGFHTSFRDESELASIYESPLQYRRFDDYFVSGDQWRWHGVSSFVIATAAFRSVGGFRTGRVNGEDAELTMRIGCLPGFVEIASPPTFGYRTHDGNITSDIDKSLEGIVDLIHGEQSGRFPGGPIRKRERRRIISRFARSWAITALKEGRSRTAWSIYFQTLRWHVEARRLRFLLAIPLLYAYVCLLGSRWSKRSIPRLP
jgi:glycosyltransferase involved in cell wall biosynthesis